MDWIIKFNKKAKKQLLDLDKATQKQIDKFILKLMKSDNPRKFGESLKGDLHLFWRYRIGSYRLICTIEDNIFQVEVIRIGHRKDVYKKEI